MHPENQGNVEPLRFSVAHYLAKDTVAHLRGLTEAEILNCDRYLPGSTKKDSRAVVYAYLKAGMSFKRAVELITELANDESQVYSRWSLRPRAMKIFNKDLTIKNLYHTYRGLQALGKGFQSLRWLLNPARREWKSQMSILRKQLSRRICQEMVAEHGSIENASVVTNVPADYIHIWLGVQHKRA
jgi:hypothetical protein